MGWGALTALLCCGGRANLRLCCAAVPLFSSKACLPAHSWPTFPPPAHPPRSCCTSPTPTARHMCMPPLGGMPTQWISTCGVLAVVAACCLPQLGAGSVFAWEKAALCLAAPRPAPARLLHPVPQLPCTPRCLLEQGPQPAHLGEPEPGAHGAVPRHPAAGAGQLPVPGGVSALSLLGTPWQLHVLCVGL